MPILSHEKQYSNLFKVQNLGYREESSKDAGTFGWSLLIFTGLLNN